MRGEKRGLSSCVKSLHDELPMNYRENLSNYIVFLQSTGKAIKEQFTRSLLIIVTFQEFINI